MPEEALSMRKIREVLRLSALGLAQHQIARSCSIVQSTVHKYLKLAEAAKIHWPLPENLTDRQLDELRWHCRGGRGNGTQPELLAVKKMDAEWRAQANFARAAATNTTETK